MGDLIVAVGLVLVLEGLIWALVPQAALQLLEAASRTPLATLRIYGWAAVAAGLVLVWLIRG